MAYINIKNKRSAVGIFKDTQPLYMPTTQKPWQTFTQCYYYIQFLKKFFTN